MIICDIIRPIMTKKTKQNDKLVLNLLDRIDLIENHLRDIINTNDKSNVLNSELTRELLTKRLVSLKDKLKNITKKP
jgi:hypothetical protein